MAREFKEVARLRGDDQKYASNYDKIFAKKSPNDIDQTLIDQLTAKNEKLLNEIKENEKDIERLKEKIKKRGND